VRGDACAPFFAIDLAHQQPFVCVGFVLPQLICPIGESQAYFHRQTAWEGGLFNHS
jgi:hypothetical protein